MADLSLVSRYCGVANYSYPRKGSCSAATAASCKETRCSSNASSRGRESVDSEGSAPGLIDDRTDSEESVDDDYQYHTHVAELWDTFWSQRNDPKASQESSPPPPSEHCAALMPSPRSKRQAAEDSFRKPLAWPLADCASPSSRPKDPCRKMAATYSAFPKPPAPPPNRSLPPIPVRSDKGQAVTTRPGTAYHADSSKPHRPARPVDNLLTPCIPQFAFVPVIYTASGSPKQKEFDISPISPTNCSRRRPSVAFSFQPGDMTDSEGLPERPSRPSIYSVVSHSATHLSAPEVRPSAPHKAPRHFKSMAALTSSQVEQTPQSVFEDDTDDDDHGRKLFSFHRRSESSSDHKRRRNRSNTTPSPPLIEENLRLRPSSQLKQRHGHDVFGRLLGRRSR